MENLAGLGYPGCVYRHGMEQTKQGQPTNLRPLSSVQAGQTVRLHAIKAGRGLSRRLAAMGLLPGVELTVVRHQPGGPIVVSVRQTKVILGKGATDRILVY